MTEGVASIPTSGGCWGYPPTDQGTKAEGGIKPALPNDTNKATSLPSEDPYSTSALSINASPGASLTADSTTWLLWSGSLSAYSRTGGGRPQGTSRLHAHRTIGNPGISSMSMSRIVKDEIMGITYMDTITTSVGRVTISGPGSGSLPHWSYNRGHNRPPINGQPKTAVGWMNGHSPTAKKNIPNTHC